MAGAVKPANPPSTVLREIIQASFDEARSKRNAARRSFHNRLSSPKVDALRSKVDRARSRITYRLGRPEIG
jgi:hypothetical protein